MTHLFVLSLQFVTNATTGINAVLGSLKLRPGDELLATDHDYVDTVVDGAHAPGMVPLNLSTLAPAYYAANLHKWVCAPKGSAFLWAREDKQRELQPAVISHGNELNRGVQIPGAGSCITRTPARTRWQLWRYRQATGWRGQILGISGHSKSGVTSTIPPASSSLVSPLAQTSSFRSN